MISILGSTDLTGFGCIIEKEELSTFTPALICRAYLCAQPSRSRVSWFQINLTISPFSRKFNTIITLFTRRLLIFHINLSDNYINGQKQSRQLSQIPQLLFEETSWLSLKINFPARNWGFTRRIRAIIVGLVKIDHEPQPTSVIQSRQNELDALVLDKSHDLSTWRKKTRYFGP